MQFEEKRCVISLYYSYLRNSFIIIKSDLLRVLCLKGFRDNFDIQQVSHHITTISSKVQLQSNIFVSFRETNDLRLPSVVTEPCLGHSLQSAVFVRFIPPEVSVWLLKLPTSVKSAEYRYEECVHTVLSIPHSPLNHLVNIRSLSHHSLAFPVLLPATPPPLISPLLSLHLPLLVFSSFS